MEFRFQISGYDDPVLEREVPQALEQRLSAYSRKTLPGVWAVTDKLNAAKGPGRSVRRTRYRIYGVFLIALGIFALVPGLMEPRTPSLIAAGALGIAAGLAEFWLVRKPKPHAPPAGCRKEGARLLEGLRNSDWALARAEVRFQGEGAVFSAGNGSGRIIPWREVAGFFEEEHIWLLLCGDDRAVVLQKKDLTAGEPEEFSAFVRKNINN